MTIQHTGKASQLFLTCLQLFAQTKRAQLVLHVVAEVAQVGAVCMILKD